MPDQREPVPHIIRPIQPADRAFVVETTLKVRQPRGITWREWEALRKPETLAMVERGSVLVVEAVGVLLGFATACDGALQMLYVKRDFRGDGLGLHLLRGLEVAEILGTGVLAVVNPTASWRAWARSRGIAWRQAETERRAA